jgi:zinc finger-containing ubiquitin peptidase 1
VSGLSAILSENDESNKGARCELNAFVGSEDVPAHDFLRMAVVEYFHLGSPLNSEEKVIQTRLPPIYLQHRGDFLATFIV